MLKAQRPRQVDFSFLGTANTLVGVAGEGLVLDEPSVAAVHRQTRRILAGGTIADFELCEAMLRFFLRKAQPPGLRFKPRVLVTVPGCATPVEKRAVFNSVLRAGARQVFLVQEALAAALGAGMPVAEPTGLPVRCPTILPTETRRRVNCERERWASPAATRDSSPFIVHHSSIRNPQSAISMSSFDWHQFRRDRQRNRISMRGGLRSITPPPFCRAKDRTPWPVRATWQG